MIGPGTRESAPGVVLAICVMQKVKVGNFIIAQYFVK